MIPIFTPTFQLLEWFQKEYPWMGYAASYIRVNWLATFHGVV